MALLTRTDMAAMSPSDAARFLSVVLNHPLTANAIRVKRYNLRSAQRPDYRCRVTAEMEAISVGVMPSVRFCWMTPTPTP